MWFYFYVTISVVRLNVNLEIFGLCTIVYDFFGFLVISQCSLKCRRLYIFLDSFFILTQAMNTKVHSQYDLTILFVSRILGVFQCNIPNFCRLIS